MRTMTQDNFEKQREYIRGASGLHDRLYREIKTVATNNTVVGMEECDGKVTIQMRYHASLLCRVEIGADGMATVELYNGGWFTTSTKERLNGCIRAIFRHSDEPCHHSVFQKGYSWYFTSPTGTVPFGDRRPFSVQLVDRVR